MDLQELMDAYFEEGLTRELEKILNKLTMAGIKVLCFDSIPSRYAVIDKEILWYGSMNLVSNVKEDDDEMRIVNRSIAKALIDEKTIDI